MVAYKVNREFSKSVSDSVKHFTEHSGLDELAHHDNVKILFLSAVCGNVPGALGPLLRGVTDDCSTVTAWLSRDKMPFASRQAHF